MKLLYITTVPTPYKVAFFEELGKLCDLTVFFENKEVSYREKGWMITEFHNFHAYFLKGINVKDKKISFEVCRFINAKKYDKIIVSVYSTITQMIGQEYMRKQKIDYVISSDGGMIKEDSKLAYIIKKHFIESASAWLSTGKVTTEYLTHYGADPARVFVYPFTSISEKDVLVRADTQLKKTEFRTQLGIKYESMVVSVGQFIHRKGFDVLIQAGSKLKNTGIYIIGGSPTNEYLDLCKKCGADNIHFVKFKNRDELSVYYRASDCFVLPTREDIWGLVVNEAMAYGLPVITTNKCVAGLEMIDDGENGRIVSADSIDDLYCAMKSMIDKLSISREMMSEACLRKAREYTFENMAQKHIEILNRI